MSGKSRGSNLYLDEGRILGKENLREIFDNTGIVEGQRVVNEWAFPTGRGEEGGTGTSYKKTTEGSG